MSGLVLENGHPAGNHYDKYGSANPLVKHMMSGFMRAIEAFARQTGVSTVHELGCGEGHLATALHTWGFTVRGSDVSSEVIALARENASQQKLPIDFQVTDIAQLNHEQDAAPLVVCCEVLEHLEDPDSALEVLAGLASPYLLVSVPREPLWRCLNMCRGHYLSDLGNTPGHLQHWSKRRFLGFLAQHLDIVAVASPVPWTIALCKRPTSI